MLIEKYLKNKAIIAVASIVIGVFMIIRGGTLADDMVRVIGYILIGAAAAYLITFFTGDNRDQMLLWYAAAIGICGFLLVWRAGTIVSLIPVLAGAVLILNGVVNLTQGEGAPAYSKGTPILLILLGILIIIFKYTVINAVVILLGIALVLNGLSSLDIIRRV